MSVRDITPDTVLAAVQGGADDIFKLAEHFEVTHVSYTLRSTVAGLGKSGRLVRFAVPGSPTPRFEVTQ